MPDSQPTKKVTATSTMRGTCYVIGAFAVATILLLGTLGYINVSQLDALLHNGKVTQGTITDKHERENRTHDYFLLYSYQDGGKNYDGEQEVDFEAYGKANVGDPIQITYVSSNPSVHREGTVSEGRVNGEVKGWTEAILAVLVLALAYLIPLRKESKLQKHILQYGLQTQGQIFEDVISPKAAFHKVKYRFTDNHGISHDRKAVIPGNKGKDLMSTMITVYYLEGKEDKSRILREFNLAKLV